MKFKQFIVSVLVIFGLFSCYIAAKESLAEFIDNSIKMPVGDIVEHSSPAQSPSRPYEKQLEKIYPRLEVQNYSDKKYLQLFYNASKKFDRKHLLHFEDILLKNDAQDDYRGLAGRSTIMINSYNLSDEEFVGVTVHELCHVVDLGGVNEKNKYQESPYADGDIPIYSSDPSVEFYNISWVNNRDLRSDSAYKDFVTGYAQSDPFEDLAESCTFYVLHNEEFKALARTNTRLKKKYLWLKKHFFHDYIFDTGAKTTNTKDREWDSTVLSFDLKNLINIIPPYRQKKSLVKKEEL